MKDKVVIKDLSSYNDLMKSVRRKQLYATKERVVDIADDIFDFSCKYNGKITAIRYFVNIRNELIICKDGEHIDCNLTLYRKNISDYDFDHCSFINSNDEDSDTEYYLGMYYGIHSHIIRGFTNSVGEMSEVYIGNDAFVIVSNILLYAEGYEDQLDEDVRALFITPLID